MPEAPRYVVDASTAVKWYLEDEPQTQESLVLLTDYRRGKVSLLAPDQIRYEVPAALRRAVIRNRLSREDGRSLIESFQALGIPTVGSNSLVLIAYVSAFQLGCSFYDGLVCGTRLCRSVPSGLRRPAPL